MHRQTELALLGFLKKNPRHGYDLYQELSEPEGLWQVWRMKQSQLYALLNRLEEQGYLAFSREAEGSRPPRKMYRMTPSGREAYASWVRAPVERGRQFRLDLWIKLFFAHREGGAVVTELLDAQQAACLDWQRELEEKGVSREDAEPYRRVVHQYRAGQVQAMLDWLDSSRNELTRPIVNG
jgi:DNA-binding PadR family transcriptional regulator